MHRSALFALLGFCLSVASVEITSLSPSFSKAGIQGCIGAAKNADGQPLIIHNCATASTSNEDWAVSFFTGTQSAGPQPIVLFGNKCIDVPNGVNADGTRLQIWTCVKGSKNQQWISRSDSTFQWSGTNKCIDLTNGAITDGNVLQIWTCSTNNNANQKWIGASQVVPSSAATVKVTTSTSGGGPYCIAAANNADGAKVALVSCYNSDFHTTYPNGSITWTVPVYPSIGQIQTFNNKCLDVPSGSTANGVKLQIWTCTAGNQNQLWQVRVDSALSQIEWNGSGKCIDLTSGNTVSGNQIQMWDCAVPDNNANQDWFRPTFS
ncbi:ricin B lectin domain-containing protein [Mycena sanguinolenta]|nr:ricin B lectin domain-containing protein [Mycena sanguinolenta]